MTHSISIIIPTFYRPETLDRCLQCIHSQLQTNLIFEVIVLDNGQCDQTKAIVEKYKHHLNEIVYIRNPFGHGLGYSVTKGVGLAKYDLILELNDDALLPTDALSCIANTFELHPDIGVVGVRAIEKGYSLEEGGIGTIDALGMRIVGNFSTETDVIVDVEHVYGFCYAYRKAVLAGGGIHDHNLIAQDYSSGCRLETDHCLSIRRLGYRVVYDGRIGVIHLAKPRQDIAEASLSWRLNDIRNTSYVFLKHFGLTKKKFLSLRYLFLYDLGLLSLIKHPTRANLDYFMVGLKGRISALWHWLYFLIRGNGRLDHSERQPR